ncbi:MAG: Dabb family protein [Thermodesulfobacteriota bacterium]
MIRHIVLFKMKEGTRAEEREELIEALKGLKAKVPVVKELEVGVDVGGSPRSYDLALSSTFESMEDVGVYSAHPDHIEVVGRINELCEPVVKVDYEF